MAQQPVNRCYRHGAGIEQALSIDEWLTAGYQQVPALVPVHHQLKKQRGVRLVLENIADVINDAEVKAIEAVQHLGQDLITLRPQQRGGRKNRAKRSGAIR